MKFRPQKRFGQNFLKDKNIARKIVSLIELPSPLLVVEIGPGKGVLTEFLLPVCEKYIGVEIDNILVQNLREQYGANPNFTVIQQDILDVDLGEFILQYPEHSFAVIGNIPYNITSPILFKLFEKADMIHQAVLMVQKEVAERITAKPGSKAYGVISIFSQVFAHVRYSFTVPAKLFYPAPKVDSAVLHFCFRKNVTAQFPDFELFSNTIRCCFRYRRKMLRNSLSVLFSKEVLRKLEDPLTRRPEDLTIDEWRILVDKIHTLLKKDS
ncbi:MAG: 16S rRNA (adenine(1518)-N(6)/adenine(1519)-N(6))-dimethyltransferase RsmA [Calditrichia bacterium]